MSDQLPEKLPNLLPQKWELRQELAQWHFKLMTSEAAPQKLLAFQELLAAPLSQEHKVYLFLNSLRDERQAIQDAALSGLQCLGLTPRIMAPLKKFLQGDRQGLATLKEIMLVLSPLDGLAIFLAVIQILETSKAVDAQRLLELLLPLSQKVSLSPSVVITLIRALVDASFAQDPELSSRLARLFSTLAHQMPATVYPLLWEEVAVRQSGTKRRFLLLILSEIGIQPEQEAEFFNIITGKELDAYLQTPQSIYWFEKDLTTRHERSLPLLCQKLSQEQVKYPAVLVEMIERIIGNVPLTESQTTQVCQAILKAIQTAGLPALQRLLWGTLFQKQDLPKHWCRAFAQEIVLMLLNHKSVPEFYEEITQALIRLGQPAWEIMGNVLLAEGYQVRSAEGGVHLLQCIKEVLLYLGEQQWQRFPKLAHFIAVSMERLQEISAGKIEIGQQKLVGEWALFLVLLLRSRVWGSKTSVRQFIHFLRTAVLKCPATGGLITAVGEMSRVVTVPVAQRTGLIQLLLGLLQRNWDMTEYELPQESKESADTEAVQLHLYWLPELLREAGKIWTQLPKKNVYRKQLLETILRKWQRVLSWQEIWGPGNCDLLLQLLGEWGSRDDLAAFEKKALLAAIVQGWEKFSPTSVLGSLVHLLPQGITKLPYQSLVEKVLAALAEDETLAGAYRILGLLLSHQVLTGQLETQALYSLLKGNHARHPEAQETVTGLLQNPRLPAPYRKFFNTEGNF